MELRPRQNETLRCGFCHDALPAEDALFATDADHGHRFATLAMHRECFGEANAGSQRFAEAPLAYGVARALDEQLLAFPPAGFEVLLELGAELATGRGGRPITLDQDSPGLLAVAGLVRLRGVVLRPIRLASRGGLKMENDDGRFVNVYEPMTISSDEAKLRLCLHDSLGLKITRGLAFSGGRQLREGSYHSSVGLSRGLVTLDITGVASVVYNRGDFVDVEGGITMSRPPSTLPRELHPTMLDRELERKSRGLDADGKTP